MIVDTNKDWPWIILCFLVAPFVFGFTSAALHDLFSDPAPKPHQSVVIDLAPGQTSVCGMKTDGEHCMVMATPKPAT